MNYLIISLVIILLIAIVWRLSSKRYVIPCPSYLAWIVDIDNPFAKENRSKQIISHLNLTRPVHIADVGCGPGRVAIPLAKKLQVGSKLLAVDIQKDMLNKVRNKSKNIKNIEFKLGSLGDQVLENNTYDYILLVNVLGEIPETKKALQEVFNALKQGGILSITETVFDPHYQRLKTLETMVTCEGFEKPVIFGKWYSYTAHFKVVK